MNIYEVEVYCKDDTLLLIDVSYHSVGCVVCYHMRDAQESYVTPCNIKPTLVKQIVENTCC